MLYRTIDKYTFRPCVLSFGGRNVNRNRRRLRRDWSAPLRKVQYTLYINKLTSTLQEKNVFSQIPAVRALALITLSTNETEHYQAHHFNLLPLHQYYLQFTCISIHVHICIYVWGMQKGCPPQAYQHISCIVGYVLRKSEARESQELILERKYMLGLTL